MTRRILMTLILSMALAATAAAQTPAPTSASVMTEGRASIKVTPDIAWLTVTSDARAPRPGAAQRAAAMAIDNVRTSLRTAGVKDDAVKTRAYSVNPEMQYANGKSTVIGYIATHSLDVRVDNLTELGAIIDAAGGSGATSVSDIRYDVKQRDHVVIDLDEGLARIGDLGNVGHSDELSHRLHSSGSSHMTGREPAGHARGVAAPSPRPPQLTRRIRLPIARASASRTCGIVIRSKTC